MRVELNDILARMWIFVRGVVVVSAVAAAFVALVVAALGLGSVFEVGLPTPSRLWSEVRPRAAQALAAVGLVATIINAPNLLGVSVNRSSPSQDDEFAENLRSLVVSAELPFVLRFLTPFPRLHRPVRLWLNRRVVFLVDELDRAHPSNIVETLAALQL